MLRRRLPALLVTAVTLVAAALVLMACDGAPEQAPGEPAEPQRTLPGPPEVGDPAALDEARLGDVVQWAAATGDRAPLAGLELPPRVAKVRVAVRLLHDHLLGVRAPAPEWAGLCSALDALAACGGGAEGEVDVAAMVDRWAAWSDVDRAAERDLARIVRDAQALLSTAGAPDAAAMSALAQRAAAVDPPAGSPAAGLVPLLHLAARSLAVPRGDFDAEAQRLLEASRAAFEGGLGWRGGGADLLAALALHLVRSDEASILSVRMFEAALARSLPKRDPLQPAGGDPLRAGLLLVDRAALTDDPRRAEAIVRRGRGLVWESGDRGVGLFRTLDVHARLQQAIGLHHAAEGTARGGVVVAGFAAIDPAAVAALRGVRAVSLFRLGQFDDAQAEAAAAAEGLGDDAPAELRAGLLETAGEAALEVGRPDDAARLYRQAAAAHSAGRERDVDLLRAAQADVRAGRTAAAIDAVRSVLGAGSHPHSTLALAAETLIDAGELDVAQQIVEQAEAALGRERRDAFGEVAGRLFAARGEVIAARERFAAAVSFVTRGQPGAHGPPAARILFRWAQLEEQVGDLDRAVLLLRQAHAHVADNQAIVPRDRARRELVRLLRQLSRDDEAWGWAEARHRNGPVLDSADVARLDLFLICVNLAVAGAEPRPDPSGVRPPPYREQTDALIAEFASPDVRAALRAYADARPGLSDDDVAQRDEELRRLVEDR